MSLEVAPPVVLDDRRRPLEDFSELLVEFRQLHRIGRDHSVLGVVEVATIHAFWER